MIQHVDISNLAALQENWDGYGATRIKQPALDVLAALTAVPCVDGGVQIEWVRNGWDVTIMLDPDGGFKGVIAERTST